LIEADGAICVHLSPFLSELKREGSSVVGVSDDAWSNCVLSVTLDRGPGIAQAQNVLTLPAGIKLWHNDDGHYAIENGLFCDSCKHSLSWPRLERKL
jgi:hypothetical protein